MVGILDDWKETKEKLLLFVRLNHNKRLNAISFDERRVKEMRLELNNEGKIIMDAFNIIDKIIKDVHIQDK